MRFNPIAKAENRATMRLDVDIKESAFPSALDASVFDNLKSDKAGSDDNSSESAFLSAKQRASQSARKRSEATGVLALQTRVALKESQLVGTVVNYHNSTYGPRGNKKAFNGYVIDWDNAGLGICENADLQIVETL